MTTLVRLTTIIWISTTLSTWAFFSGTSEKIQRQIEDIEEELNQHPNFTPTTAPWTLGYSSRSLSPTNEPHTITITFHEPAPVDLITLMPAAYADDENKLRPLGFPRHFYLERQDTNGVWEIISDYRVKPFRIVGIHPQFFHCPDAKIIKAIRLTTTAPSKNKTWWSQDYLVAMAEIYAFSGNWNVALNAKVKVSSVKWLGNIWSPKCLVDGFTMFSPVDRRFYDPKEHFFVYAEKLTVLFDLGATQAIDELRLWPVVLSLQHNYPSASGIGFPRGIQVSSLVSTNDPNPKIVFNSSSHLPQPGSTPYNHRIVPVESRYFQITLSDGIPEYYASKTKKIALSEIQLLHKGQLQTGGKLAQIGFSQSSKRRDTRAALLTDGLTNEGKILPLRNSIETFSLRQKLKVERNKLRADLSLSLGQEKERMTFFAIAATAIIIILSLMIWVVKLLGSRRWARMREKIACDLHDEVGANLSSIAHSTELMRELIPTPSAMQAELMEDAIQTARLTARETRQFIQLLEQRDTGISVVESISKIAHQILGNIEHHCHFTKSKIFNQLDPSRQWDLFFFLKESLNNIIKHAGATRVDITTKRKGSAIQLTIEDNGCGIAEDRFPLRHLESRAKHMQGDLHITSEIDKGTKITLTLKKWKS